MLMMDQKSHVYRIFQEIFANIGKHAGAGSFSMEGTRLEDTVHFVVQDDGTAGGIT